MSTLLGYSNTILGAIQAGNTVAGIWSAVQAAAEDIGGDLGGASIFDMNYVAGRLRAVAGAESAFGAAQPEQDIDQAMWAWAPWSGPTNASEINPVYQLRYQYQAITPEGDAQWLWGQTDWQGSLDVTKQAILDRVTGSAQASIDTGSPGAAAILGDLTGVYVAGIGAVQVMRV